MTENARRSGWPWHSWALVVTLVAGPAVVIAWLVPDAPESARLTAVSTIILMALVLGCAIVLETHWLLTRSHATGWLTTCTALFALHGITLTALELGGAANPSTMAPAFLVAALLVVMIALAEVMTPRVDPLALGLWLGLLAAGATVAAATSVPEPPSGRLGPAAAVASFGVLVVLALQRLRAFPRWGRLNLQAAAAALTTSRVIGQVTSPASGEPAASPAAGLAELAAMGIGTALLCVVAARLLSTALRENSRTIAALQSRLVELELSGRADREVIHELRGSIAGIVSAAELLASDRGVAALGGTAPRNGTNALTEMLHREASRLQRLVAAEVPATPAPLDLDDLVRPLVVAHRVRGLDVRHEPTGLHVVAVADRLSEVLNILLANAHMHAPGAVVSILAEQHGDRVVMRVADNGPGIPDGLAETLFERGTQRPDSPGSGIGLHIARRLMVQDGNFLDVDPSHTDGTAFVLGLLAAQRVDA